MIDTPRILEIPREETAVIRLKVPRSEIQQVMDPAIQEVIEAAKAQGLGPIGPVFTRHFRITPDEFDFEVGVPVSAPVTATGRVVPSELPAATVARTIYHGPYEGLAEAWPAFLSWIAREGLSTEQSLWERYVVGPEVTSKPDEWQTELNRVLINAK